MARKIKVYEDTTVWIEVQDIIKRSKGTRLFRYEGVIHTPEEDIGVWELNTIEVIRNFVEDVSSVAKITFRVGLGDYVTRIYPHRTNLEFTLKRTSMHESSTKKKASEKPLVKRFKVIFNPKNNPPVTASDLQTVRRENLNQVDMPELQFELLDRCMEPLRIKTTSGCYRNKKLIDVMRATLGYESQKVLVDGKPAIDCLDIVDPCNKAEIANVIFPSATTLSSIPTKLQQEIGVYNKGMGTYYQLYREKKTWFVYPLYDSRRFDKVEYKAIFYTVPQEKLPQLDRSYWEDGKILKIAVTAQRTYNDSAEIEMMNRGCGFRMPDARPYMKKPIEITEECPVGKRCNLNHEVITKERDDGLNFAPMSGIGPSANPFMMKSRVLAYTFAQIDLVWENADEELIYPGMPCKYIYLSQGEVLELKGQILFAHIFSSRAEKQDVQSYRTVIRLSIAVEAHRDIPVNEFKNIPGETDD